MDLEQAREIFLQVLSSIPGIVSIHEINLSSDQIDEENRKDINEILQVEKLQKGWRFGCSLVILYGLSAKSIVNQIYKQLKFILSKNKEKIYGINIFIKGVHYE